MKALDTCARSPTLHRMHSLHISDLRPCADDKAVPCRCVRFLELADPQKIS